jgi:hypothetical protein
MKLERHKAANFHEQGCCPVRFSPAPQQDPKAQSLRSWAELALLQLFRCGGREQHKRALHLIGLAVLNALDKQSAAWTIHDLTLVLQVPAGLHKPCNADQVEGVFLVPQQTGRAHFYYLQRGVTGTTICCCYLPNCGARLLSLAIQTARPKRFNAPLSAVQQGRWRQSCQTCAYQRTASWFTKLMNRPTIARWR